MTPCRLLQRANSLDHVKAVRDKAEAVRTYAKAAKLGLNIQNHAAEVRLRAERKAGSFLAALKLRGGDRRSKGHRVTLKLEDLGISRQQSKRWQRLASLPEEDLLDFVRTANELGQEITSSSLLRTANKSNERRRKRRKDKRYSTVTCPTCRGSEGETLASYMELANHCELLNEILTPFYEGQMKFKRAERQVASRIVGEMSQLIEELKNEWLASHS